VSLSTLAAGTTAHVVSVGSGSTLSALERRLLQFGFVHGEQVEILAEARPGRDPFVVRIGNTTLALRRREAQSVFVELHPAANASLLPARKETAESVPLQAAPATAGEPARPRR